MDGDGYQNLECWSYEVTLKAGCRGYGMLGVRDVGGTGCWGYGMLGVRDVGGTGCWGLWDRQECTT